MGKKRGSGEGSIYQRGDGKWVGVVHDGYQGGKRKRKYLYGKTRKEVKDKLTAKLHDQNAGLPISFERQTLGQYLTYWLENSVKGTRRESTYRSYEQIVRLHLIPDLGRIQLQELVPQHVQTLVNNKLNSNLSPRTVQYVLATLSCSLKQGVRWGTLPRNVAELVDSPRVLRKEVVPLSQVEARALLDAAKDHRYQALLSVAIALGLRLGEIRGLTWDDVDLETRTLRVRCQLQRVNKGWQFSEPKSRQSRRVVSLPEVCVIALQQHRARQLDEQLASDEQPANLNLVFCTAIGTPLDDSNLRREMKKLLAKAGLRHIRFHDLRHTCASFLLAQNVSARVVMEILGHSQYALTMDTYSHVMPAMMRDAASQMDATFEAIGQR